MLSADAAVVQPDPSNPAAIVVTAARVPQTKEKTAASATVIDRKSIERQGEPLLYSLLRLTPSAAVETSGPAGSLTEVRIRGAEANHTLLFIDGIRANDPATGDFPRFELLNADIASRLEVVRGPQSALWGSEAIGGVVAVNGVADAARGYSASAERGSFGFGRAGASLGLGSDRASLAAGVGWQRATGIDSFNGHGDKDGYRNLSGRLLGSWRLSPGVELGASGFSLSGTSEFDGFDPVTFVHADTLDSSRNRLSAGRLWANVGSESSGLSGTISTSLLGSSNRNFLASTEQNRTSGERWTADAQVQDRFSTGPIANTAIVALEHDRERFYARDTVYGGATDQDRGRSHDAVTGEWRVELTPVSMDVAVRRDRFSSFKGATTLRASAMVDVTGGFALAGSYGEGIAQPTFFDLYGVFPSDFFGNPRLKPESSRGFDGSIRYRRGAIEAALTGYKQSLRDEIVNVFDPATFLFTAENRQGVSRRSGIEAELGWHIADRLRLTADYSYLHATQPGDLGGQVREVRRPKHSGAVAIDGSSGRLTYGGSLAYIGARSDTNFDVYPAQAVRLHAYWLSGGRIAYAVRPGLELFARGSNLLGAHYQDVFGYRTEGRGLYAGIRLAGRRSSP
jgi:vitamin B12 transporter